MAEIVRPDDLIARSLPLLRERHGAEVWLVGGWVRDRLLARETHDVDYVVAGGAVATARAIADRLGGAFVLLDAERDTARVVFGPAPRSTCLDLAGLRAPSIEVDLLERDYTVNAMAVPAPAWQRPEEALIDPAGGRRDLELGLLRAVSPEAFGDDPLRMVRGVRLSALLGFGLASQTAGWIKHDAELLQSVSRERVRDELMLILGLPQTQSSLRLLDDLGLLEQILPELASLRTVAATGAAQASVLAHSLEALDTVEWMCNWLDGEERAEPDQPWQVFEAALQPYRRQLASRLETVLPGGHRAAALLLLAALLHDVGKGGAGRGEVAQEGRVLAHDVLGASMVATAMRRLCFSTAETQRVRLAVANHMRPGQLVQESGGQPSRRAIYRFFRDAGPSGPDIILFSLADHLATRGGFPDREHWRRHLALSVALLSAYYEQREEVVEPVPLIDGHDLMESLNLLPGPEVGGLLESVREAQAAGEVHSRDEAMGLAQQLLAKGHPAR